MDDYIKREDAIDAAAGWGDRGLPLAILEDIKTIPAADVVEGRHGKNIGEDYDAVDQFVCSECGIELQGWYRVERDMDDGEETYHEHVFRYCPNCGAKMDGGEDDAAD